MRQVRVAAHVHSSWSYDGEWSLDDIARVFRRLRYDVVMMADHDRGFDQQRWDAYQRACAHASTNDILLAPGMEYSDPDNVVHTVVWGREMPFLGQGRSTLDVLRAADERDAVTVFAHPWRRNAVARYRRDWAPMLTGVEIWNRKYDGVAPRKEAKMLAERDGLAPFAALDFHTARQFFPLAMTVAIDGTPTVEAVVAAIRADACRPEFLGLSAVRFTRGVEGSALEGLELTRRKLRGPLRRLGTSRAATRLPQP